MRVLITGVNGFIGSALKRHCLEAGYTVYGSARQAGGEALIGSGDIHGHTEWGPALKDIEAVVHLAARVHIMKDSAADPLAAFREVNTAGTLNLARQAAATGVRRFVFVSSIKVNGEYTSPGYPFRHDDPACPLDSYGISKKEAEDGLKEIAIATGMEVVIIRPSLVYGPGVKANFAALGHWIERRLPLPFGHLTQNRRSLVSLTNLVSLLGTCLTHPRASGQTFLVSDGHDVSTRELVERMASSMGRSPRLISMPPAVLLAAGRVTGRVATVERLVQSLQIDLEHTREMLGWSPVQTIEAAFAEWAQSRT